MNLRRLPAVIKRELATAKFPINYIAACKAVALCVRVDEVLDISDRCIAVAAYAKQIKDTSLLDGANRIRLRATDRLGELLAEMSVVEQKATGLSWQARQLAAGMREVPRPILTAAVDRPHGVPTPTTLVRAHVASINVRADRKSMLASPEKDKQRHAFESMDQCLGSAGEELKSYMQPMSADPVRAAYQVTLDRAVLGTRDAQEIQAVLSSIAELRHILVEVEKRFHSRLAALKLVKIK